MSNRCAWFLMVCVLIIGGQIQQGEAQQIAIVTGVESLKGQIDDGVQVSQYAQRPVYIKPQNINLRTTDDPKHVTVKFRDELKVTLGTDGIPADRSAKYLRSQQAVDLFNQMRLSGGEWQRMAGAPEEDMDRFRVTAESNLNREMPDLNNYFVLRVPDGVNAEEWINKLNALPEVELALPMPRAVPLPVPTSYQNLQGYLNRADTGVATLYAWSISDSGQNVVICDFEYSWNLAHQDLPAGITKFIPSQYTVGWTDYDLFSDDNHGTAVLGEMVSRNNGWGTTGAVYGATVKVAPTYFKRNDGLDSAWDLGAAMTYAMTQLNSGDVFLIEQQYPGPLYLGIYGNDTGLISIEWYPPWYDVVLTAIGNGIHVVEAAGNGYQNLDSIIYRQGNYGHWPFLAEANSGAIMVGAGAAHSAFNGTDVKRSRLAFSNYGSRLNLQGWGERVKTTGYGHLYKLEGKNLYYDSSFSGTSSASPIVASAVALVESRFEALYGRAITPATMRSILINTGSAQQSGTYPSSQKIGPLPNVQSAINFAANTLAGGTYTVGATGNYLNLTAVSNELKSKILTGNVIFELKSDYNGLHTEVLPIDFTEFTTSGGDWTVTIRPAIGVTGRLTSGKPPGYYPLLRLNSINRITFDGRPGGTGTTSEWLMRNGRLDSLSPTILFTNGADDNSITFLKVEGENNYTGGGTVQFGTIVDSLGNRRNIVSHCVVSGRTDGGGLPANAIYAEWLSSSTPNDSNSIIANEILNWTNVGILLNGERWIVDSNSIYHTVALVTNMTGIQVNNGNGHHIDYNYIGGSAIHGGGAPLVNNGAVAFIGIQLTVDTVSATSVQGNQIKNIILPNPGPAGFMGINFMMGKVNIGTISGNIIGDTLTAGSIQIAGTGNVGGINIQNFMPGVVNIFKNKIANVVQVSPTPGQFRAISLLNFKTQDIEQNEIKNVGPVMPLATNYVYGIFIQGVIAETTKIINNMVSLGIGMNNRCTYVGIFDAGPNPNPLYVYHNSVYISGVSSGIDSTYAYRCDGVSMVKIFNNIFSNERVGGSGHHYAIANMVHPLGFLPGSSDYNIFYNLDSTKLTRWLGPSATLTGWRMMSMCDMNSKNENPQYNNTAIANLHMNPAIYSPADNAGFSLAAVATDFDGESRGLAPDIGADEYTINAPQVFALLLPGNGSMGQPLTGTLTWQRSQAAGRYDVYLDTLSPPTTIVSSGKADTIYGYAGLDSNHVYYWAVTGKNSSGNTVATSAPWSFRTYSAGQTMVSTTVMDGWNMLSVPLIVDDYSKSILFQNAVSDAFTYTGSYVSDDTLENGVGYWVKYSGTQTVTIAGTSDEEDTVDLTSGWNMIGSITYTVNTDSIEKIPGDMVLSSYFGYNGTYAEVDSIVPGYAYWVKSDKTGQLRLRRHAAVISPSNVPQFVDLSVELGTLTISNSNSDGKKLYFGRIGNSAVNPSAYELPPAPPKGAFDVRFASGMYVETWSGDERKDIPIIISSEAYPVTIEWQVPGSFDGAHSLIVNGKTHQLAGAGAITLKEETPSVKLVISALKNPEVPKIFSLEQNFPNPFNPSTLISYQLPINSRMAIKIYDVLGQEVANLFDGFQEAGYHTVLWEAKDIPSGVYYCRMTAQGFIQTNTMILVR